MFSKRVFSFLVMMAVGFLFIPQGRSDPLTNSRKLKIIFDYAEACHWVAPPQCTQAERDPNFRSSSLWISYNDLCAAYQPSTCLMDFALRGEPLIPYDPQLHSPLSLSDFMKLENFILGARVFCRNTLDSGLTSCINDDLARRPPDRRIFRMLRGGDHDEIFHYFPQELSWFAAFCVRGIEMSPEECLMHYAPQKPTPTNAEVDLIFQFADQCRWQGPTNCFRRSPDLERTSLSLSYQSLCGWQKPSSCLSARGQLRDDPASPSPLSLYDFILVNNIIDGAKRVCGESWSGGGLDGCRRYDQENRHEPSTILDHDRRFFRLLAWGDSGTSYNLFEPEQLGQYEGVDVNRDENFTRVHYAPERPGRGLLDFPLIPGLEMFPHPHIMMGGEGGRSPGEGPRPPGATSPPSPSEGGETTIPPSGTDISGNAGRPSELTPAPAPPADESKSAATGGETLKCSLSISSPARLPLSSLYLPLVGLFVIFFKKRKDLRPSKKDWISDSLRR